MTEYGAIEAFLSTLPRLVILYTAWKYGYFE
jgi:hypothetical protein